MTSICKTNLFSTIAMDLPSSFGTSQQHVANDFVRILSEAMDASTKKVSNLLRLKCKTQLKVDLTGKDTVPKDGTATSSKLSVNNSRCHSPAQILYEEVEYQLVPLPTAIINIPGRSSSAIQELYFEAENIPPLGYSAFYITPVRDQLHVDGLTVQVSQNFYYYGQGQGVQSGAYSFRPDKQRPTPVTERVTYQTIKGSLIKEIRQRFNDWITQIIRLYRGEEFLDVEWIIGPVPIGTDLGKEVVTVFTTNISNNGQFYTDSNGRQMIKRTCWNESLGQQQKKPVPSCYYPVTSRICIHSLNSSVEMCVLPDRTQGGTSYNEGEIELMVHRRLLTDDGFGLEESLNEEDHGVGLVIKGRHRIYVGNFRQEIDELTFSERISHAARRWQMEPWMFFASGEKINRRKWQNVRNKRYSSIRLHGLPRHIHILTLEPWKAGSVLLRLENTLEKPVRGGLHEKLDNPDDFPSKSSHITVELKKIFLQWKIKMVKETTLAANQWLEDARQMDWSTRRLLLKSEEALAKKKETQPKSETGRYVNL
ncbi:unnamed protein product [Diatraea saccharalis]|uniref:Alpha-mannosidase n=1 Tax=Diatraea saccharalis TaxID=40085 RepID=A0A9N9RBX3_9NEOP|nr:unnamed protein product [Diatraea saccharalis]